MEKDSEEDCILDNVFLKVIQINSKSILSLIKKDESRMSIVLFSLPDLKIIKENQFESVGDFAVKVTVPSLPEIQKLSAA